MEPDERRPGGGTGPAYLDHLTDEDLTALAGGRVDLAFIRTHPESVEELLARPGVYESVSVGSRDERYPLLAVSPFLVFALAVRRAADDLRSASFVAEWVGPRQRLPILDTAELTEFLADPWRRFFLVELLASYTHVASGVVWERTRRGWRRRRFSELDPIRLASLLEVVPEPDRAGVYRRLGDLALFLTGVFPDHTSRHGLHPLDHARLLRAAGLGPSSFLAAEPDPGGLGTVGVLEQLGERWYRLACSRAPAPLTGTMRAVTHVADRFPVARRTLNYLTDRHLFPFRGQWFPAPA